MNRKALIYIGKCIFRSAVLVVLTMGMGGSLFAFTSVSRATFAASAFVSGGVPPSDPILLRHTPLVRASAVKKQIIIQGKAGLNPDAASSSFGSAVTPEYGAKAAGQDVKVTIYFRFITDPQDPNIPPFEELGNAFGTDPMPFAFLVTPDRVAEGTLQYKILAEKFNLDFSDTIPVSTIWFPDGVQNAQDDVAVTLGVAAQASEVFGAQGGQMVVQDGNPNVGNTILNIPAGIFQGPVTITLNEVPLDSPILPDPKGFSDPVAFYSFNTDQNFKGSILMSFLYPDFVFPDGQDGLIDVVEKPERTATIFWFDGFDWRAIGGRGDPNSNLLTAKINRPGILAIASAPPIKPEDRRPMEKIMTPNGDGINDSAIFSFGGLFDNVTVEIYDMTGHRVKTILSSNSFEWDGRDDSGKIVESGAYIYQYSLEGKRVSGLIAVAK